MNPFSFSNAIWADASKQIEAGNGSFSKNEDKEKLIPGYSNQLSKDSILIVNRNNLFKK